MRYPYIDVLHIGHVRKKAVLEPSGVLWKAQGGDTATFSELHCISLVPQS